MCFEEALEVLEAAPDWASSIKVELNLSSTIAVWADRKQMFTVFSHLIQNGLAFCPEGNEIITVEAREIDGGETRDGNDAVEITIADNGTGLEEGQENLIFEPFYTTRADGTGLGLAVVKQTVEEHRGQISVANGDQSGAIFTINLPIPQHE